MDICHSPVKFHNLSVFAGKAIKQPLLDIFWIFLVQMNTKGFPFVPCGSQHNHTTSKQIISHNSAISWPIWDLFVTIEHPSNPILAMGFSMESRNLAGESCHNSTISWQILDLFVTKEDHWIPFFPCASQWNHTTSQKVNSHNCAISWHILDLFGTNKGKGPPFHPIWSSMKSRNLAGKIAITQPYLDSFWIFLVKMNTKGFPFFPCGSQWNHKTSQEVNKHN